MKKLIRIMNCIHALPVQMLDVIVAIIMYL